MSIQGKRGSKGTPLGKTFEMQIQVLDPMKTAEQKIMGLASPLGSINGVEKTKKFRFFDFQYLMSHRGKGYHTS